MTPGSEGSVDCVLIDNTARIDPGLSPGSDHLTELVDETDNGWTRDKVCFILSQDNQHFINNQRKSINDGLK